LFELPYSDISNVYSGKNEVAIECSTSDTGKGSKEDQLVECRFHVPGMAPSENEDGVDVDGDANSEKEGDSNALSAAEVSILDVRNVQL
jgi:structure-specific recognition protein 1